MQQQICQQDQLGNQQAMPQQMVLCPVRLVYETQIFMQPGEQIHPNQTYFLNPHNPPPWAQNRPQNQVLYVQQLPSNIVPNIPQHMDQNQMYVHQNFANYQISHPMMAPTQEQIRPMQITNMIPSNMVRNCSNIQDERNVAQTITYMANNGQNTVPNQANAVTNNRQTMTNVGTATQTNQSVINPQTVAELQRQPAYTTVKPQMLQQPNMVRPQVVTMNSIQNMQHLQQQQIIGQSFAQNMVQTPVQNQMANVPRVVQPNTITNATKMREATLISNVNNNFNSPISNPRNVQTFYRPIQPRPQFRQTMINMPNLNNQAQVTSQVQNIPSALNSNNNRYSNTPNANASYTINTDSKMYNRKRKSESPDELHAKMSANHNIRISDNTRLGNMVIKKLPTSTDIGVNTNPVAKTEHNMSNQNTSQIIRYVDSGQQTMPEEKRIIIKPLSATVPNQTQTDKEKLIRNTVYTQARGRLLSDKQNNTVQDVNMENSKSTEVQTETEKIEAKKDVIKIENSNETLSQAETKATLDSASKENNTKVETNTEIMDSDSSKEETLLPDKITFKQEKDYILTHVLDGYVIQESNIAFPIRKPLKEKTPNMKNVDEQNAKEEVNDKVKDEVPRDNSKIIDLPLLPLYYLHLNNKQQEDEVKGESEDIKKDVPFASHQQATVKSWTVDQLAAHLTKYNWTDTVSVLQEHEIDGESLFLVSKAQLLKIGVNEHHADAICEFVKKT